MNGFTYFVPLHGGGTFQPGDALQREMIFPQSCQHPDGLVAAAARELQSLPPTRCTNRSFADHVSRIQRLIWALRCMGTINLLVDNRFELEQPPLSERFAPFQSAYKLCFAGQRIKGFEEAKE